MSIKQKLLHGVFNWLGNTSPKVRKRVSGFLYFIAPLIIRKRFHVVKRNLEVCFPNASADEIKQLSQQHFRALAQSMVDRAVLWFGPKEVIEQMVEIKGAEIINNLTAQNKPVIMLAPHFTSLDAAATIISLNIPAGATIYTAQKDKDFDDMMRHGRARFNDITLISRKEGVRGMIRLLKKGVPVYYLPDMDFGPKGSIFVPFFNTMAATLTATAQIAQSWQVNVLPILSRWDPETGKYLVEVLPPLENFPGQQDITQATTRINQLLEEWIQREPSQYYWVHKRFKTRPEGQKSIY